MKPVRFFSPSKRQRGFSLVELMVALVLGLLVSGGVIGVFLSHREVYRQNEALARMQESARYAFEVMARSLREAGGIACGSNLNGASSNWWSNWGNGIQGYENTDNTPKAFETGAANRVSGTDAVIVLSGLGSTPAIIIDHTLTDSLPDHTPTDSLRGFFTLKDSTHGFQSGDVLMACDYGKAALFQATTISGSMIGHATLGPMSPGNNGALPQFQNGGQLTQLAAHAWYIGNNGRGGRSLYRLRLQNNKNNSGTAAATAEEVAEEVAEGVSDLQIQYLTRDGSGNLATDYVDATAVTDWTKVVAARLVFTLQSLENVAVGGATLTRTWNTVVTLRNRAL